MARTREPRPRKEPKMGGGERPSRRYEPHTTPEVAAGWFVPASPDRAMNPNVVEAIVPDAGTNHPAPTLMISKPPVFVRPDDAAGSIALGP